MKYYTPQNIFHFLFQKTSLVLIQTKQKTLMFFDSIVPVFNPFPDHELETQSNWSKLRNTLIGPLTKFNHFLSNDPTANI